MYIDPLIRIASASSLLVKCSGSVWCDVTYWMVTNRTFLLVSWWFLMVFEFALNFQHAEILNYRPLLRSNETFQIWPVFKLTCMFLVLQRCQCVAVLLYFPLPSRCLSTFCHPTGPSDVTHHHLPPPEESERCDFLPEGRDESVSDSTSVQWEQLCSKNVIYCNPYWSDCLVY